MTSHVDRVMNDALALGRANAITIELARRHCIHMTFTEWGGRGMAEDASGLPINSRRVHCPYAQGDGAAMNLDWIATDFYEEHCDGCQYREPTGELPNLASVIEDRKAEAATAAESRRRASEQRRVQWHLRSDRRRGLVAAADPAMAKAIDDMGVLDVEPGAEVDDDMRAAALRRLNALADRAPDTFEQEVIDLALELVEQVRISCLLAPLRHLAQKRDELRGAVALAAVTTLRLSPDVDAGRCVTDFHEYLDIATIDASVVRSMVYLAGAPEDDFLGHRRRSAANDPGPLRVAGDLPTTIVTVLREMLPPPSAPSPLVLPPGERARASGHTDGDHDRASAARAALALATTHPNIAAQLIGDLVRNLGVDPDDDYDPYPMGTVTHTLATILVLDIGDVEATLERAGRTASEELRERLFDVYEQAGRLLDPNDRWREPGDPQLTVERRRVVFERLTTVCLARVGGDWGHEISYSAANLIEDLAKMEPSWALDHLHALLGGFLTVVHRINERPTSRLTVVDATPAELLAMEDFSKRHSFAATARDLLKAVEHAAAFDVGAVCAAVGDIIVFERDNEAGVDVVWRLLPLLGKIGRHYGAEPGVLRSILPTLHTYLLDNEVALRSAALDAWTEIAMSHQVPASVADLLPALLNDAHVAVIRSLLKAGRRLTWSDENRMRLLAYAIHICESLSANEHADLLKEAMSTVGTLTRENIRLRSSAEHLLLSRAKDLNAYDLEDALRRPWLPESARSGDMAGLRLRQARDPRINDRFNARDDEELCALLDCGPGLKALTVEDLTTAALELAPDAPLAAAEFAEVAWRAGRPADAATIMRAVVAATPNVPAYDRQRFLSEFLARAALFDVAAITGADLNQPALDLAKTIAGAGGEGDKRLSDLLGQSSLRVRLRCLLSGVSVPSAFANPNNNNDVGSAGGPSQAMRRQADSLTEAAEELGRMSQRATSTAAYARLFASLCEVGAHLLRLDAGELDAEAESADANLKAAQRRAAILESEIAEDFASDDPLAGPLLTALAMVKSHNGGSVAPILRGWAALPLPVLIVDGPRHNRPHPQSQAEAEATNESLDNHVAVVLASVDGRLITGPQVLRPNFAYELRLEVRPGEWPDWADRLDAEFIGHLTDAEVQIPTFSWRRAADFEEDSTLTGDGTLLLRFGLGAGQPAPPFLVTLRWRGSRDGEAITEIVDVAGHSELRFRPFDASRDYLTDFRVFDERLFILYENLHRAGYDEDQIQAFCRLFTAVCRAGLTMTWDKRYKRGTRVLEREFHDDLYARLHKEPELGGRLERGTPMALGFLDVRHDGITAELKVERRTPVSKETAPKYMGQPTQYAAADGARLSILCVLDLSPKTSPIGTPENYMFTLQPALHGLNNPEAPSLVSVIVVNGGLPTPSSWSRHKAAVQQTSPTKLK